VIDKSHPTPGEAEAEDGALSTLAHAQMIELVAAQTGLDRARSEEAVAAMLDTIVTALQKGKRVGLPGLGTFRLVPITAKNRARVAFTISSTLRQEL